MDFTTALNLALSFLGLHLGVGGGANGGLHLS